MNFNSKIDVSFNKVSIPLDQLLELARIAVGCCKTDAEREITSIQYSLMTPNEEHLNTTKFASRKLMVAAQQLNQLVELLCALESARTRETIEITK